MDDLNTAVSPFTISRLLRDIYESESSGYVTYSIKAVYVLAGWVIVDISKNPLLAFFLQQQFASEEIASSLDGRGVCIPMKLGMEQYLLILIRFNCCLSAEWHEPNQAHPSAPSQENAALGFGITQEKESRCRLSNVPNVLLSDLEVNECLTLHAQVISIERRFLCLLNDTFPPVHSVTHCTLGWIAK